MQQFQFGLADRGGCGPGVLSQLLLQFGFDRQLRLKRHHAMRTQRQQHAAIHRQIAEMALFGLAGRRQERRPFQLVRLQIDCQQFTIREGQVIVIANSNASTCRPGVSGFELQRMTLIRMQDIHPPNGILTDDHRFFTEDPRQIQGGIARLRPDFLTVAETQADNARFFRRGENDSVTHDDRRRGGPTLIQFSRLHRFILRL